MFHNGQQYRPPGIQGGIRPPTGSSLSVSVPSGSVPGFVVDLPGPLYFTLTCLKSLSMPAGEISWRALVTSSVRSPYCCVYPGNQNGNTALSLLEREGCRNPYTFQRDNDSLRLVYRRSAFLFLLRLDKPSEFLQQSYGVFAMVSAGSTEFVQYKLLLLSGACPVPLMYCLKILSLRS